MWIFLRGVELIRRSGYGYGPCMAGHGLGMDTAPVWLDMVWVWIRPIHDPCTVGYDRCTAGYGWVRLRYGKTHTYTRH